MRLQFRHQQMGEPELTKEDKQNIAKVFHSTYIYCNKYVYQK